MAVKEKKGKFSYHTFLLFGKVHSFISLKTCSKGVVFSTQLHCIFTLATKPIFVICYHPEKMFLEEAFPYMEVQLT